MALARILGLIVALGLGLGAAIWTYRTNQAERAAVAASAAVQPQTYRAEGSASWVSRVTLTSEQLRRGQQEGVLPPFARSVMNLRTPLRHGEYLWSDQGTASGPIHIWVDLTRQMISVFRGGTEIGTAVIVYGAPQMESPTGSYPILSKVSDYHSASYDAPMPYSLFITRTGVALHGSKMASDHATHGCIGLPLPFARALFGAAQQGDLVTIVKSTPSSRMPGHPTT